MALPLSPDLPPPWGPASVVESEPGMVAPDPYTLPRRPVRTVDIGTRRAVERYAVTAAGRGDVGTLRECVAYLGRRPGPGEHLPPPPGSSLPRGVGRG